MLLDLLAGAPGERPGLAALTLVNPADLDGRYTCMRNHQAEHMRALRKNAVAAGLLGLAACAAAPLPAKVPAAPAVLEPGSNALPLRMPIHGVMIGIIDFSSFGVVQSAVTDRQLSESDWKAAGLAALNLIAASTLVTIPGTGANDAAWTSDAEWRQFAAQMQNASVAAAIAVRNRNRPALGAAAEALANSCQACHSRFRPDPPPPIRQARPGPASSPLFPGAIPALSADRWQTMDAR